jgi:opacity protein-like surface antigen
MRLLFLAGTMLLAAASIASAQDASPWNAPYRDAWSGLASSGYMGVRGSLVFSSDIGAHIDVPPPNSAKISLHTGGGGSLFAGLRLKDGFRIELEGLYRSMKLSDIAIANASVKLDGDGEMFAPMANLYWDLPVYNFPIRPYIGGGVGYAWNQVGLNGVGGTAITPLHNDSWRFAYNALAGVAVPFRRNARFTLGYRWLHEDIGIDCAIVSAHCSGQLNSHSIDIGIEIDN